MKLGERALNAMANELARVQAHLATATGKPAPQLVPGNLHHGAPIAPSKVGRQKAWAPTGPAPVPAGMPMPDADMAKRIIDACTFFYPVALSRSQLAALSHISRTTKQFISTMTELGRLGKIVESSSARYTVTGRSDIAGPWAALDDASGRVTVIIERARMDSMAHAVLHALLKAPHGEGMNRDALAAACNISRTTKRFISAVSFLDECNFVKTGGGRVRLSSLILEGRQ